MSFTFPHFPTTPSFFFKKNSAHLHQSWYVHYSLVVSLPLSRSLSCSWCRTRAHFLSNDTNIGSSKSLKLLFGGNFRERERDNWMRGKFARARFVYSIVFYVSLSLSLFDAFSRFTLSLSASFSFKRKTGRLGQGAKSLVIFQAVFSQPRAALEGRFRGNDGSENDDDDGTVATTPAFTGGTEFRSEVTAR